MLDQSETVSYLLALGLVKPRSVVDGSLVVSDTSRRNRVFVVTAGAEPTYVVKQATPGNAATLQHEVAVLRVLAGDPALAGHVPVVVDHDASAARFVQRSPRGARDLNAQQKTGRIAKAPARALGQALARLHGTTVGDTIDGPPGADPMWGLRLPEPPFGDVVDMSAAARDIVERLQADRALCDGLETLRAQTAQDDALVHGDLRWDNCLAVAAPGAARRTRVLIIDWELAGRGVAAYDVGTVLAEYLRAWVASIPIAAPDDPARLVALARLPLSRMRPAAAAFWSAYRGASARPPDLGAVMRLAAARLLQVAVERADATSVTTAHTVTLLQLAANTLRAPEEAGAGLLGLSP